MNHVGILAYGSLIGCPGGEIEAEISRRLKKGIKTPFKVEFAHSSGTRGGAPTLVPVVKGGAHVEAIILVLKNRVSIKKAKDMLWRREANQVCSDKSYKHCSNPGPNTVCINELKNFKNIKNVLYTCIKPDIANLTPCELAKLAIMSVCKLGGAQNRDGITYLFEAKRNGIKTRKMEKYEEEIKRQTRTKSLEDALEKLQSERHK